MPVALAQEWDELEPDLAAAIAIRPEQVIDYERQAITPLTEFDDRHFSKRELRIMAELVSQYGKEYSPKMIDVTHTENGAWIKVWNDGKGFNQRISYNLSIADNEPYRDVILEAAKEYHAITDSAQG